MSNKLRVLELFGGIGACTNALDRLNIDYEIADYVEIDKYATASYNTLHNTNYAPQDIREWNKDIDVDLIMHGSPCTNISLAGKQAGADIGSGTQSSLMWETVRIVKKLKPKYVVWENVKNILSEKHIHNFQKYLDELNDIGYNNYYKVLCSKDYGIPQHRERVFTISILKKLNKGFNFPLPIKLEKFLKDILEDDVDIKYYLTNYQLDCIKHSSFLSNRNSIQNKEYCDTIMARDYKSPKCVCVGNLKGEKWDKLYESGRRVYSENGISPSLHSCGGGNTETKILEDTVVRKLTPLEYWRLQGFSDEYFYKASKVNSNSQLYKQAGNSITVDVLYYILKNLLTDDKVNSYSEYNKIELF